MKNSNLATGIILIFLTTATALSQWSEAKAPAIPEADGYIEIPNVAIPPQKNHVYKAIYDATTGATDPSQLTPAINMAGSELNALSVARVSLKNAKFVIVFHGEGMNGILDDDHYKAAFGVSNPNLKVLASMKKLGVKLYVCGQNLAAAKIDPKSITPDVTVASDALIVLMEYQNKGYALMSF
jgi:intracellular sulfur oxidation DsrE/DsrF family protein